MDARDIARADWTASRAASAVVAKAWRSSPDWLALADAFDATAASSLPVARDRATALLGDPGWATRLLAPLVAALAADPLAEPPLRVHRERGRIGAVLFDAPAARVTASVASARALVDRPATSVVAAGHLSVARYVRTGGVRIRRWRIEGDRAVEIAPVSPRDGDVIVTDGRCEGQLLTRTAADIVTLTVILRAGAGPLTREYAIEDGRLIRSASTDDGASRAAMLLTLLRISGRADAPDLFDAATRDPAPHARWSAMREWLALDAAAATPRLGDMAADDPDDDVRQTAQATLALVERRRAACPA